MRDNFQDKLDEHLFLTIKSEKLKTEAKVRKVEYLISIGADVNAKVDKFDETPALLEAVKQKEVGVAKILLQNGANVRGGNRSGKTALLKAVELGDVKALDLMVEYGDCVKNYNEYLLLQDAGERNNVSMVYRLIELGVDVNKKNDYGFTHLISVLAQRNRQMFNLLIDNGADVNLCREKDSPLMIAVLKGDEYFVKKLIEKGANLNLQDKIGRTALMIAVERGNSKATKILLENGANIWTKDNNGDDVFVYAREFFKQEVFDMLSQYKKIKNKKMEYNFFKFKDR